MNEEQKNEINQMRNTLIELTGTKFWPVIKLFSNIARLNIDGANRSLDPVKNPTNIARNQGMWLGVGELEGYVNGELQKIKEEQKEEAEKAKEDK